MSQIPDTRASLLVRIQDPDNRTAWQEFVEIYRPVIYRLARNRGFQDADAQDLVQCVLVSVSRSIDQWDAARHTRFRSWLNTITRNAIVDAVRRRKPDLPAGGSAVVQRLQQQPEETTRDEIRMEYRRQIFRRAADEIRVEFSADIWQAFQLTMIERLSVSDTARLLEKSVGAIYAARGRVMQRLRQRVLELENVD